MSNWNDDQNGGWGAPPPPPSQGGPQGSQGEGQSFHDQFTTPSSPLGRFQLGPMTFGDVLDTTFQLMKNNWKQLGIAALVYAVPVAIASLIANAGGGSSSGGWGIGGAFTGIQSLGDASQESLSAVEVAAQLLGGLLLVGLGLLLEPFVNGAITRLVAGEYLGRDMTARQAFTGVRPLFWRFVFAAILVSLCISAGVIAFLVGAIVIAILLTAVIPVIAIEEERVFDSLGRSWALMKRRFWTYLGIRIAVFFIVVFISIVVQLPLSLITAIFSFIGLDFLSAFFYGIGVGLGTVVTMPIAAIVATLLYFDARVRFEGFDVQMMASRIPQQQQLPPTPPTPPAPPTPPTQ